MTLQSTLSAFGGGNVEPPYVTDPDAVDDGCPVCGYTPPDNGHPGSHILEEHPEVVDGTLRAKASTNGGVPRSNGTEYDISASEPDEPSRENTESKPNRKLTALANRDAGAESATSGGVTCENCGTLVSHGYAKVFGDNENRVEACWACQPRSERY